MACNNKGLQYRDQGNGNWLGNRGRTIEKF